MSRKITMGLTGVMLIIMLLSVSAIIFQTNTTSAGVTISPDTEDPTISIISPATGSYNNTGSVLISWTSNDAMSGVAYHELTLDSGPIITLPSDVQSLELNGQADGSHTVMVAAYDGASNHEEATVTFTVDTVDPIISIVSPVNHSYNNTGSVLVAWTSTDALSGIAYHELRLDSGPTLTLPSDVQSLQLNSLADGSHTVSVTAYDNAGNHNETTVTFTVDRIDPTISIISPATGSYNNTGSVLVAWSSHDTLSGIAYHELRVDSGPTLTLPSDVQSLQLNSLAEGGHKVYLAAYDNAGNHNQTNASFIVDSAGPVITATPASPIYSNSMFGAEVHISVTDSIPLKSANVSLYSNGVYMEGGPIFGMAGETSFGYWALVSTEPGVNSYRFTATDSAGNSNSIVVTVFRDVAPPTVRILSPVNHAYNNTGSMTLKWSIQASVDIDRYEVFVNGGKVATLGAGNTSYVLSLPEGNDEIVLYVYDVAANSVHTSVNVITDLTGPLVAITAPVGGEHIGASSVTVSWQGANPLSGINHYKVAVDGLEGIEVSANTLTYAFTGLADGSHTVSVTAYDNAGNLMESSVTFTVDRAAPTVSIISPRDGSFNGTGSVHVSWSADDVLSGIAKIEISVDGTTYTNVTGTTSRTVTLADGAYSVQIRATDGAGNVNSSSVEISVDKDVPTVTISPSGSDVRVNAAVVASFSEGMNHSSTTIVVAGVVGTIIWSGNNATFTPSAALSYNTAYTITVTGHDLAGKAVTMTGVFTTMRDEGTIAGVITDADGKAIAGASVMLSNGMKTRSDVHGAFSFVNVTSGDYEITVSRNGYETFTRSVSAIAGETTSLGSAGVLAAAPDTGSGTIVGLVVAGFVGLMLLIAVVMREKKAK